MGGGGGGGGAGGQPDLSDFPDPDFGKINFHIRKIGKQFFANISLPDHFRTFLGRNAKIHSKSNLNAYERNYFFQKTKKPRKYCSALHMTQFSLNCSFLLKFHFGGGGGGGGQLKKSQKKSKSISGILGWVLTFFDPKF